MSRCDLCWHPEHPPFACEKALDEPRALYGPCDCPTGHEHCPDLRRLESLPANAAGWARPDGGYYAAPCDTAGCDVRLVVSMSRPTSLYDHRAWPITGDWMTDEEAGEAAAEEAHHYAQLNRGYVHDRM